MDFGQRLGEYPQWLRFADTVENVKQKRRPMSSIPRTMANRRELG
jgi:hypothetical protein